jgi:hypothetical protein
VEALLCLRPALALPLSVRREDQGVASGERGSWRKGVHTLALNSP